MRVAAPDSDRSGVAHSLSIHSPVRVRQIKDRTVPTFACFGTPADCVVIGAYELYETPPDVVVSGINRGANAGDDVTYSGTVAAAHEALLIGIPSVAVSLAVSWPIPKEEARWDTAARCALDAVRDLAALALPPTTLLNINVPNVAYADLRGIRYTKQARKRYSDRTDRRLDPRGEMYVWIWGGHNEAEIEDGTDLAALRDGFASITPISIDRTDDATLARLATFGLPPVL